ncbi:hypothetical protein [Sphingomonas faeni]|uniref:hypothetical protein n=1 Tax=Sphingomonas faeni TaxID=185950 RepID=UPI0033521B96
MQLIGFFVDAGWDVSGLQALSIFETANAVLAERRYACRLLSHEGGTLKATNGVELLTRPLAQCYMDTLFLTHACASACLWSNVADDLFEACWAARRVAASSEGTFALAELGLLDDRRVVTHHSDTAEFRRRFPSVDSSTRTDVLVDKSIWTSAIETHGVDMAMRLIQRDAGIEVAREVAGRTLIAHCGPGGHVENARPHDRSLEIEFETERVMMATLRR